MLNSTSNLLIQRSPKIKSWILSNGNFNVFLPLEGKAKFHLHLMNKVASVWILIDGKRTFKDIYELAKPRMEKEELKIILQLLLTKELIRIKSLPNAR